MTDFELDPRLASDCLVLGTINENLLLLMNNSLVPWFILVPRTEETELTDLPATQQSSVLEAINLLAGFLKHNFKIQKLNIGAIGNIVSQLHIHVVGRDPSDYCWPGVVWGATEKTPWTKAQINEIVARLGDLPEENIIIDYTDNTP